MSKFNQNVDLNLYKTFYAVAQNKSFSKASEDIYISQPAISYNISKLEEQLGVKLFYRTSKGAILTTEGEELFGYIKSAYEYIYLGEQSVKNSKELMTGNIKIGVPTHIGDFYLTQKVKDFHSKYPNILFSIQSRPTADMVYMLETHRLDFIIDSYPINKNNEDLNTKKLMSLNTILVTSKKYKEKYKNVIKKGQIKNLPLILPSNNTSTRRAINAYFKKLNIKLNTVMEISTTEMSLDVVKKGIGIGWIIENVLNDELKKDLFKLNLEIDLPKIDIEIAYIDKFISYAAKKFIEEEIGK